MFPTPGRLSCLAAAPARRPGKSRTMLRQNFAFRPCSDALPALLRLAVRSRPRPSRCSRKARSRPRSHRGRATMPAASSAAPRCTCLQHIPAAFMPATAIGRTGRDPKGCRVPRSWCSTGPARAGSDPCVLEKSLILFENPWAANSMPSRARRFCERLPWFDLGRSIANWTADDALITAQLGRRQIESMHR